ncbi:TPA: hypothetical protein I9092_002197 [Clostridium perfringens]|nr:hypothetical protein [Clostridium perfringens]
MLSLYFNNIRIPDWVKVTNITEDILPTLEATKYKTKLGEKKITIDFKFKRNKLIDHKRKTELLTWLKGDNFKLSKLILPNRIDFYYMAKVTNFSSISGTIRKGEGSIEFTCFNYQEIQANAIKLNITDTTEKIINYTGSEDVYPVFIFKVISACDKIKIRDSNSNFLEFNNSFNKGDILEITQSTNKVMLNNSLNMQIWHLKSKRIKFIPGLNSLKLEDGNVEVTVKWNNKYL